MQFKRITVIVAALLSVSAVQVEAADKQGAANVQLIKDFLRDIRVAMMSRDSAKARAVAERYMDEDYIQHSKNYAPGREGFIKSMSAMPPGPPPGASASGPPGGAMPTPKDLYFIGDGEFVVWVSEGMAPGKLDFNMVRVVKGKMKEHWDSAGGPPASPGAPPELDFTAGSPSGFGTTISSDPKLLAPLPPPPEEALRQYPPSSDPRNLEGVWLADPMSFPTGALPQMPLTEAAKQNVLNKVRRQREADEQGKTLLTDAGRCRPMQAIAMGSELFPAEVVQTPDKIVVLNEEGRGRWVIHMNSKHPRDVKPTHFGHSIGHWEGDTLVVDTIGLRASEGAFGRGMRSDQARVVSRLHKSAGGSRLELASTIYDSETYTQPVDGGKSMASWHPELTVLEFQCEENMEGAREGMIE